MNELIKRILTSTFLISLFILSFFNKFLLFFVLIFCYYEIYNEFFNLLKRIFISKNKLKLYFYSFLVLIFLLYLFCFIYFTILNNIEEDIIFLLLLISVSITSDIGGFVFGKIFKGKKLTSISPNKTFSGMYGSYVFSLLLILIYKNFIEFNYLFIVIIIISTISQFGDIFISYLKRKSNLKDTGHILPGHGGMLDRFDGQIFALSFGSLFLLIS